MTVARTIDVTTIAPQERHGLIFQTFDELLPGELLLVKSDHDPSPLMAQFKDRRPDIFELDLKKNSDSDWNLEIKRIKPTSCCGCGC